MTPPGDVAFDSAEVSLCRILYFDHVLTLQTSTSHALPKSQGRSEVHYLLCSKKAVFISFGIN